jgi:hypothetical protein
MSRPHLVGNIMVILGGVLFVCALALLPFFEAFDREPTLWDLTTREPVLLTVVAVADVVAAAGSLLTRNAVLLTLTTAFSFYVFGRIFPIGAETYHLLGVGFWVATAAAVTMSIGALLAVIGDTRLSRSLDSRAEHAVRPSWPPPNG